MSSKPGSGVTAFAAAGALAAGYWLAPDNSWSVDARAYGWIAAGSFALAGAVLGMQAVTAGDSRPSPWRSPMGRITWALRPRGWMLAWAAIVAGALIWGTPHLLWQYPPRTPVGSCDVVGLSGIERVNVAVECPWVVWF